MDSATSATKLPIKRKTPQTATATATATGTTAATRSSKYQRIWTEEDEIAFLQCLSQNDMSSSLPLFYESFSSSHPYYSKSQLYDKLRRLRKKFHVISSRLSQGLTAVALLSPHDQALYDLSSKVWGSQSASVGNGTGRIAADFSVGSDFGTVGFDDDFRVGVSVAKSSEGANVGFEGNDGFRSDFGVTVVKPSEGMSFGRKGSLGVERDFGVSVVKSVGDTSDFGVSVVMPDCRKTHDGDFGVSVAKSSDGVNWGFGNDLVKRDLEVSVIKLSEGVNVARKGKQSVSSDFGLSGGVNVDRKGKHSVTSDFGLSGGANVDRKGKHGVTIDFGLSEGVGHEGIDGVTNDFGVSVVKLRGRANVGCEGNDRISRGYGVSIVKSSEGGSADCTGNDTVMSGLVASVGFRDLNAGIEVFNSSEGANVDCKGNSSVLSGFGAVGNGDFNVGTKLGEGGNLSGASGGELKSVIKSVLEECLIDVRRVVVGKGRSICSDFEAKWREQRAAEFDVLAQRLRLALDSSVNK